ncbi:MAG: RHS repeat-associated core domain-containing protein [Clostridia bacterium]|nr:RHS repeat-associated core domain-containing protein [Clostridia bacterium]
MVYCKRSKTTPAQYNPYRYRGYYYDADLGLYYLNSRYYDAVVGRFINPDAVMASVCGDLRGSNFYAYCFNNPVNMSDSDGNWASWNDFWKDVEDNYV